MLANTCCVTGHRKIANEKIEYVYQKLNAEIQLAITSGYTHFISGFADGTDLIFAEIVAKLKQCYPHIKLIAAIPYRNRLETPNKKFQNLISKNDQ